MGTGKAFGRLRTAGRGSVTVTAVTVIALLWGRICGGRVSWNPSHRLFVCSGMRAGYARGGTCIGGAFLTGSADPPDRMLRHEAVHAEQWRTFGVTFPFRYLREEMRNPGKRNRFEIEAGLEDGGYTKRGGTHIPVRPGRRPGNRQPTAGRDRMSTTPRRARPTRPADTAVTRQGLQRNSTPPGRATRQRLAGRSVPVVGGGPALEERRECFGVIGGVVGDRLQRRR